ncbi:unnamed protein product [Closterium sp. NIES-64]|nr:unnamed protein product [Closterium sp. NIES-64]
MAGGDAKTQKNKAHNSRFSAKQEPARADKVAKDGGAAGAARRGVKGKGKGRDAVAKAERLNRNKLGRKEEGSPRGQGRKEEAHQGGRVGGRRAHQGGRVGGGVLTKGAGKQASVLAAKRALSTSSTPLPRLGEPQRIVLLIGLSHQVDVAHLADKFVEACAASGASQVGLSFRQAPEVLIRWVSAVFTLLSQVGVLRKV